MRVVDSAERLAPPSLCFICETSPQREAGVNVVDTQKDFNPPALSHLSGRKYICERCVDEAAHLLGFVRDTELNAAQTTLENARRSINLLSETLKSLTTEVAERLSEVSSYLPERLVNIQKSENVVNKEKKNGA